MRAASLSWDEQGHPFANDFEDHYFSMHGGLEESRHVFLSGNNLPNAWKDKECFIVGETGFGTGLNFLALWHSFKQDTSAPKRLHFVSVEGFPLDATSLQKAHALWPELAPYAKELQRKYPPLVEGIHRIEFEEGRLILTLCFGEATQIFPSLQMSTDAWFLDGFAPSKNESMWSEEVFKQIARLSHEGTTIATFTAAGKVRRDLMAVGFDITKVPGFIGKREMITGTFTSHEHKDLSPWFAPPSPVKHKDKKALIIGGGIAGCSCAFALAKRGWNVTILEQNECVAREASGNLCGAVMPLLTKPEAPLGRVQMNAFLLARSWWQDLAKEGEVGFDDVIQYVHEDKWQERFDEYKELDHPLVTCKEETDLGMAAFTIHGAGWARPPLLCQRAIESSERIDVLYHSEVLSIAHDGLNWSLHVKGKSEPLCAPVLIAAPGISSLELFPDHGMNLGSLRGQISYLPPVLETKAPLCAEGYVCPVVEEKQVIGATYKRGDMDRSVREQDHVENLHHVARLLGKKTDEIDAKKLEGRVSFRSVSRDRFPVIGPLHDALWYEENYKDLLWTKNQDSHKKGKYLPHLYMTTAHGSRGLVTSVLGAEIIASMLSGEPLPIERDLLDLMHPARFLVRKLKKGKF